LVFGITLLQAQGTLIPLNSKQELLIERLSLKYGNPDFFHRTIKPYFRADVIDLIQYWDSLNVLAITDLEDIRYLWNENNEWVWIKSMVYNQQPGSGSTSPPENNQMLFYKFQTTSDSILSVPASYYYSRKPILKYFYRSPGHLLEVNKNDFYLRLNPVINMQAGRERTAGDLVLANQRGIDLRVGLDNKIYAQTTIIDNQVSLPAFFRSKVEKHKALPGAGFYKYFTSSLFKPTGYDYFIGNGQLGFRLSKHFHIQLGHGNNFTGDGLRSLFLSDYAQEYFYLKTQARIWKLHYQSLFAELSASTQAATAGNILLPKKYMASHTLQIQVSPRWNLGLFETVIFNRNNHFELQYLNPVIIYRSVEGSIGSPDNVMLGINSRYDIDHRISIYGQVLIDEFVRKEVFSSSKGWWGNKFGGQLGIKYLDAFGISRLDLQLEYNSVRPYTYSHFDSTANYTHQSTPLAHPLGANFKEFIFNFRYRPVPKWNIHAYLMASHWGDDPESGGNFGSDLTKPYTSRVGDYNHFTGQGILRNIRHYGMRISYEVFHNYFIDLNTYYRQDLNNKPDKTHYIGTGIRVNFWPKDLQLL